MKNKFLRGYPLPPRTCGFRLDLGHAKLSWIFRIGQLFFTKSLYRGGLGHQNPTKGRVAFSGFSARFPPYLPDCLQNAITFFLFSLCWVWKSVLNKGIHFVCFRKKISLSVSHHFYSPFSKNWVLFAKNCVYWRGNRQTTKKYFFNEMFECFRCFFIRWLY